MSHEPSLTDRDILRRLAAEWMGVALLPIQHETIQGWKALNGLKSQRPMVYQRNSLA